jgi:hypothetical protein
VTQSQALCDPDQHIHTETHASWRPQTYTRRTKWQGTRTII